MWIILRHYAFNEPKNRRCISNINWSSCYDAPWYRTTVLMMLIMVKKKESHVLSFPALMLTVFHTRLMHALFLALMFVLNLFEVFRLNLGFLRHCMQSGRVFQHMRTSRGPEIETAVEWQPTFHIWHTGAEMDWLKLCIHCEIDSFIDVCYGTIRIHYFSFTDFFFSHGDSHTPKLMPYALVGKGKKIHLLYFGLNAFN